MRVYLVEWSHGDCTLIFAERDAAEDYRDQIKQQYPEQKVEIFERELLYGQQLYNGVL